MNLLRSRRLLVGCALIATTLLQAAPVGPGTTEGRVWKQPSDWYPRAKPEAFAGPALQYSELRFKLGDDERWARADWDDRGWQTINYVGLPARAGLFWVRFRVRLSEAEGPRLASAIGVTSVIAYEVHWDGVLLGNSGTPGGNRAAEIPGRVDNIFSVPRELLSPGEHLVAMRISSYRCGFPSPLTSFAFYVANRAVFQADVVRFVMEPAASSAAMFMVGLASLIMWLLAARQPALLLFCAMCFSGALMQGIETCRWLLDYPADWAYPAQVADTGLVCARGVFMAAFVIVHFGVPRRGWWLGGLLVLLAGIVWLTPERTNHEGPYFMVTAFVASLACAVWAMRRRKRGAGAAAAGLAISTFLICNALWLHYPIPWNFLTVFLPALLGLMSALALHLRDERRQAREAVLTAARLEIELLKKNIQPHFLLNTLATIMEVIEQEPKTAVALIEALAGEFRVLARISGEKLIPLAQELELCRAHLAVMSLRKGARCALEARGVDEYALVPPALFHTLIENGLTHLLPRDGKIDFTLSAEQFPGASRYILVACGSRQDTARGETAREGTGLRYIKARLEESFTGRWQLRSEPVVEGWCTVIEIAGKGVVNGGTL